MTIVFFYSKVSKSLRRLRFEANLSIAQSYIYKAYDYEFLFDKSVEVLMLVHA